MAKNFMVLFFLLQAILLSASNVQLLFNHQLQNAEGRSVKELNGAYYFIGNADDSLGNTKTVLTKLDKNGNLVWWKSYGDSGIHISPYINTTVAHELIMVGQKLTGTNTDFEIMLLDTFGNQIWNRSYGTVSKNESMKYVQATRDRGFIACGFTTQTNLFANDFLVVKFDSLGNIVWQKNYGTNNNDYAQLLQTTDEGNFIVSGDSYNGHDIDNYLLLLDSAGNEIWHRQVGDANDNGNQTLLINHEGNFILCGESTTTGNFEFDIYLAAFTPTGSFLWSKYVGGNGSDAGFAISENSFHQYFITGYSSSLFSGAPYTAYLLALDSSFNPTCLNYFPQPDLTICYDEILLNDSTFVLAGTSGSNFYFVLADDSACATNFTAHDFVSGFTKNEVEQNEVKVFQSSTDQLNVQINSTEILEKNCFSLFTIEGQLLCKQQFSSSLEVDLSAFESTYFVWQIQCEKGKNISGMLVKQ